MKLFSDEYFMNEALKEAKIAFDKDEIPIGAVVVSNNIIIAKAHNLTESLQDITAHAEILAITSASNNLGSKYLNNCTLYVTLEPCIMCAGALYWSKISKVIYGSNDEKQGFTNISKSTLHPKTEHYGGILLEESKALLKEFFKKKRH